MKRLSLILSSIWLLLVSGLSPYCVGIIYMYITGHAKGYAYDMGQDAGVGMFFGYCLLLLWIAALFPNLILMSRKLYKHKKYLAFVPSIVFIVAFTIVVLIMGTDTFIAFFGIGFNKFTR